MKIRTLKSGLRVITKEVLGTEAVTTLVMCGAGSRYETKDISGLSHFLEHMFFKGGKRYPDSKSVAESIDSIGGEFNAFTGKEYVGYYVTTPKEKYLQAFDVLSDMLINSKFEEREIEKERGVILEEFNMYEDMPMYKVRDEFETQIFGDNPLGWEIIGTKKVINSIQREDFLKYLKKQYKPKNMVVCVAGPLPEAEVVKNVEKYFQFDGKGEFDKPYIFEDYTKKKIALINKKTEQAHLVYGMPAFGSEDKHKKYILKLIAVVLGGNMSSRMFISIREERGLCYYIKTSFVPYVKAGYLATFAGVDLKRVEEAVTAITEEYKKIAKGDIKESELKNAQEYLKGKLTLGLEDTESLAQFYAEQLIESGEICDLKDLKQEIDSVTLKEVNDLAKKLFKSEELRLCLIGPYKDEKQFLSKMIF